jgi:hypothetical protein
MKLHSCKSSFLCILFVIFVGSSCLAIAQEGALSLGCIKADANFHCIESIHTVTTNPTPVHADPGTHTSSSGSTTSHTSSSGHSKGGGPDPNAAADLSASMHAKLDADNAARQVEMDSLTAAGAAKQSDLNTVFNNAAATTTFGPASTVAAAELTGSNQTTSDNDFAMPSPTPNADVVTPTPSPIPSMQMAPVHNQDYSDVLTNQAVGTPPSAQQIGPASPNAVINGRDDPNADPNVQALKLIGKPQLDSVVQGFQFGADLMSGGLTEGVKGLATGVVQDAVVDAVTDKVVDAYNSYQSRKSNPATPTPSPAPGPTPSKQ